MSQWLKLDLPVVKFRSSRPGYKLDLLLTAYSVLFTLSLIRRILSHKKVFGYSYLKHNRSICIDGNIVNVTQIYFSDDVVKKVNFCS